MQALVLGFCSSGYDFAIPSSRLYLAIQTLGVAIGFVGNYAPCGLSSQTNGMPVIHRKAAKHVTLPLIPSLFLSNHLSKPNHFVFSEMSTRVLITLFAGKSQSGYPIAIPVIKHLSSEMPSSRLRAF